MGKEQLPVPTGDDSIQRGEQTAEFSSGTPEGRYIAASIVLYHVGREAQHAYRQARQEEGLQSSELWFQGFIFEEIGKQMGNLCSVLEHEVPPHEYYVKSTPHGSVIAQKGVRNLGEAISEYNKEPIKDNSVLYVSLHVTEDYVRKRTATPEAITALKKDVRQATKHETPKFKFEPYLLYKGIIFLREKVANGLTPEEREQAQRALE